MEEWGESFEALTEKQFLDAVKHHRDNCRFFPCPADIHSAHRELVAKEPPRRKPLALAPGQGKRETGKLLQLQRDIMDKNPGIGFAQSWAMAKDKQGDPAA